MTKDQHDELLETINRLERKVAVAQGERQQIMRELQQEFGIQKVEQIGPLIDQYFAEYQALEKESSAFYQALQKQYGDLLR